ncbi:MAG TPA: SDR family NAD(P)-dependent oxidoreductase [Dehalococcoidia bacterium]|nr:SDR family NAD(P)-dependent oxidoreductase [Dehalococcoidia bacterium]
MGNRLEGKVAIVTGGGRGIGRGECLALAAEGARVVVNDFGGSAAGTGGEQGPADQVVAEIKKLGSDAVANYDNVADFEAGNRMVQQAMDSFGRLDIVVNNAGILRDKMIFNMTEEEWDIVLAVHLKGHFNLSKHAAVIFRQQRSGVFVHTASESGLGNRGQGNYAAAKEGIIGLSRTIARDMGGYGVRSNALRPRAGTRLVISDEMRAAAQRGGAAGMGMAGLEAFERANPPDAIGPFVVWLCTDAASNVNGRDFLVSGSFIGLYSLPEIVKKADNPAEDKIWKLEDLDKNMPSVVGDLVNQWPRKEDKPAS